MTERVLDAVTTGWPRPLNDGQNHGIGGAATGRLRRPKGGDPAWSIGHNDCGKHRHRMKRIGDCARE
jgi:hypothetical protein